MADTGLPWELPYPLPTDLVRDGADDIKALAEAVADGLDEAGNAGIGSNVVQTVKTDTFSTTSTSFVDVTGLTVTITPSTATSKILIIAQLNMGATFNGGWRLNGNGGATTYIGDAASARTRVLSGTGETGPVNPFMLSGVGVYLASPASTSAQTYKIEALAQSATWHLNRTGTDTDEVRFYRGASSLTAIEVAV